MYLYMPYLYAYIHDDKWEKIISKDPAKGHPKYNFRD